jgi:hypothetical protein
MKIYMCQRKDRDIHGICIQYNNPKLPKGKTPKAKIQYVPKQLVHGQLGLEDRGKEGRYPQSADGGAGSGA